MSIKVEALTDMIRSLSGDIAIQKIVEQGLRGDLAERDAEIEVLRKELSVLTVEPAVKANGHG